MKRSILIVLFLGIHTSSYGNEVCFKTSSDTPQPEADEDSKLEFTLDMFHKLYNKGQNLFFSPESIFESLMMTVFGAQGQTEKELRMALKLGTESKESLINKYKMDQFYQQTRNNSQYKLKLLNKLYFSSEEPIRTCVKDIFHNEIEFLNFTNETEESRLKINKFVEDETFGKIKDLVPSGDIQEGTRVAIVNTAYFKGTWEQQFKKSHTKSDLFYVSEKQVKPTMLMYQKGSFRHGISETLKSYILELPYSSTDVSMFILLPPFTNDALQETISRLNASTLRAAMDEMYPDSIEVYLPRFKIQESFELAKTLKSIGIHELFEQSANLGDFSEKPEGLSIESAIHKSYLEVNEEGATAAAATSLIGTRSGRPLEQTQFKCNHPFIFFIHDNVSKSILFIGAFHIPKK